MYFNQSDSWIENDGIGYYFSAKSGTRDEAQACCEAAGTNLASITSEEEQTFIENKCV